MAFETNRFCWHGCISTDTDASSRFYTAVLGWTVQTLPMGDSEATFFAAGGTSLAHLSTPESDGMPSHWSSFLRVDDVDASASAAVANGGQQLSPAMDITPGRICMVASPGGAPFTLFHEADDSSEHHPGGVGSVHWNELHSHKAEADVAWLVKTFGYNTEEMQMPTGAYTVLKSGEEARGGVMASHNPDAPSMWLTWFNVADIDAALERVSANGGNLILPAFDVPNVGRMGMGIDSTGGAFGLITPA